MKSRQTLFKVCCEAVDQLVFPLIFVSKCKLVLLSFRLYSSLGGSSYQATSANSAILDKLWTRVLIEPLSKEELIHVSTCTCNLKS